MRVSTRSRAAICAICAAAPMWIFADKESAGDAIGEPAGVGGEITLKAWLARNSEHLRPFFVIDVPERLTQLAASLKLDVPVRAVATPEQATAIFPTALPVLPI